MTINKGGDYIYTSFPSSFFYKPWCRRLLRCYIPLIVGRLLLDRCTGWAGGEHHHLASNVVHHVVHLHIEAAYRRGGGGSGVRIVQQQLLHTLFVGILAKLELLLLLLLLPVHSARIEKH
uniref:Uncharacterized protein n=1 Tax=Anopheles melas TaxID=34690 RepID=A0A182UI84_9DIPT